MTGQAAGEEAQDGARRDRADSGQGAAGGGADGSGRVATRVGASDCQTRPLQIEREKLKLICSLIKRFSWDHDLNSLNSNFVACAF